VLQGLQLLFTPCVDCFEYVRFERGFGNDYETCLIRLDVVRLRLSRRVVSLGLIGDPTESRTPPTSQFRASNAMLELAASILGQIIKTVDEVMMTSSTFRIKAKEFSSAELELWTSITRRQDTGYGFKTPKKTNFFQKHSLSSLREEEVQ
jgi:hypothetical protein